jgi:very-short-patch-repair endonuclease
MQSNVKPPLPTGSRSSARELRKTQTDAEQRLWHRLRGARLGGFKFRRQHAVPPYVVDFFCASAKLVVELDGSQHSESADAVRSQFLQRQGFEILRFWDNDVLNKTESVLGELLALLQARTLTPSPSPGGRGEKSEIAA